MAVTTTGLTPDEFWGKERAQLIATVNASFADLESDLVEATPGDTGMLRQGWTFSPATERKPTAIIGQSKMHFLPTELGRRPGKGISQKGQESVSRWGRRKLGLGMKESQSFAYLLSRKYKREGRVAMGFAGLARKGSKAKAVSEEIKPLDNGIIGKAFADLRRRIDAI
jgi:hypothetical protein